MWNKFTGSHIIRRACDGNAASIFQQMVKFKALRSSAFGHDVLNR
jgi:hypothetical protein